ncbi:SDR family NAD(P)-dependent oxidoreductase [Paenibacillus sp. JCM 10914]|uniref:SDR family NAD(P)-dependent oxidoreductase n=1 Tax=Paenibacillus sp. JCM 10914 TaxID=1236974 RepID=UPI0003CC496D|nr:SDR family NAD(P)-dependent oxidoreductase [Paenibacillus sp. JCM 10914]GAE06981.1 hypothetical protein JCM10914_3182 [Paenibacillus sp. JCM 10914]
MQDLFIAGGTSGMGKGLAIHYLRQGSKVTVTGSNRLRGQEFLDEAARLGAANRASFIQADLLSLSENRRVIQEVRERHESLDGLVLTAMQQFPKRKLTPDGYESTFALYYISRFVLSYGLTELLERGNHPVIVSIGGTGMTKGEIHWNDLNLQHKYGVLKLPCREGERTTCLESPTPRTIRTQKHASFLIIPDILIVARITWLNRLKPSCTSWGSSSLSRWIRVSGLLSN